MGTRKISKISSDYLVLSVRVESVDGYGSPEYSTVSFVPEWVVPHEGQRLTINQMVAPNSLLLKVHKIFENSHDDFAGRFASQAVQAEEITPHWRGLSLKFKDVMTGDSFLLTSGESVLMPLDKTYSTESFSALKESLEILFNSSMV